MSDAEISKKIQLIRSGLSECVDPDNLLKNILEKRALKIYWGTAPTGKIHIGYLIPLLKIAQLVKAGCHIQILIADLHAFLDAQKTELEQLEARTLYYQRTIQIILQDIFRVNLDNITFVRGREFQLETKYTMDMYKIASHVSFKYAQKAGSEVVKATENPLLTGLLYPILQALDEEYLGVDAQLGGLDQRKLFMFAREMLPKLGYKKRIHLMTRMMGCIRHEPGEDKEEDEDENIEQKMSASGDDSRKIGFLDSKAQIKRKIRRAWSVPGDIDDNCLIELMELCIFPILEYLDKSFLVPRAEKFGGPIIYRTFYDLKFDYFNQNLHPMDLKHGITDFLFDILSPVRTQFLGKELQELYKSAYP